MGRSGGTLQTCAGTGILQQSVRWFEREYTDQAIRHRLKSYELDRNADIHEPMQPTHTKYSETEALVFPGAIALKVLLSGHQTDGSVAIFEDIVEPGVGPGRHVHHGQDETFFFLEGQFDVEVAGVLYHMEPGDVAFVPRGTVHAFRNTGEAQGRLRYIFSPALRIEEMFRAFYLALERGDLSQEAMAEIAGEYGQNFVGPPL